MDQTGGFAASSWLVRQVAKEAVYSHLSRCTMQKALNFYLQENGVDQLPIKIASNQ